MATIRRKMGHFYPAAADPCWAATSLGTSILTFLGSEEQRNSKQV